MSLFKATSLPSYIELVVLEYADYCPTCNIYSYHTVDVCSHCNNPICKYGLLFKYNGKAVCKICRSKIAIGNSRFTFETTFNIKLQEAT